MKKLGNVLWGIVFIVVGLIIGLNAMGITSINLFFSGWWTLFIIVPSAIGLIRENSKMWSFIWLVIGVVLLLCAQDIVSFSIIAKLILPFILICLGVSILFRDVIHTKINKKIKELNKDGLSNVNAVFAGNKSVIEGPFEGSNLDAVFGGVVLDLRRAQITKDVVINSSAIFGGVTILVPKSVNVKVKSTPIFGGVDNKTIYNVAEGTPTIYVNAFSMFGGVDIK